MMVGYVRSWVVFRVQLQLECLDSENRGYGVFCACDSASDRLLAFFYSSRLFPFHHRAGRGFSRPLQDPDDITGHVDSSQSKRTSLTASPLAKPALPLLLSDR